jgi:hypothetical protein
MEQPDSGRRVVSDVLLSALFRGEGRVANPFNRTGAGAFPARRIRTLGDFLNRFPGCSLQFQRGKAACPVTWRRMTRRARMKDILSCMTPLSQEIERRAGKSAVTGRACAPDHDHMNSAANRLRNSHDHEKSFRLRLALPRAPRPSGRTAPTVTTRHWSQRPWPVRGEARWSITGETAVTPGGTRHCAPPRRLTVPALRARRRLSYRHCVGDARRMNPFGRKLSVFSPERRISDCWAVACYFHRCEAGRGNRFVYAVNQGAPRQRRRRDGRR